MCSCNHSSHEHGHGEANAEAHHHDEHGHNHSADAIILEPAKAKAAGVEVEKVQRSTFHDVIATSGKIVEASCDETVIVATVPGIVSHTHHISEGSAVQRGMVVYHINSSQMQDGDLTEHTRIAYERAEKEFNRAEALLKEKLISERDYQEIRMQYESARLSYEAIRTKQSEKGVAVTIPETGFVKDCFVKDGDYVEKGQRLLSITRNQHLYLRAEVPMRYYEQLSRITTAKFKTALSEQLYDISRMDGHLLSAGKSVSSTYSYIPVTFEFDNPGNIVPGSYAEVFLIAGERTNLLSVPTSALTEEQGLYFIYIKEGGHAYRKQEVTLGATDGERVEVKSGLSGGEQVVVAGAINVKLAGATTAVPGHTHNH